MVALTLAACLALAPVPHTGQEAHTVGYLWGADKTCPVPYAPQEGDILLTTSRDKLYALVWSIAGTDHPYHSTIFVRRTTGELESLEVGGGSSVSVTLRGVVERLTHLMQEYASKEAAAWVRRRKTPLTPEQSARLTAFAEAQFGKRFTPTPEFLRLAFQRGRLYRSGDPAQDEWFCSELLLGAIEQADLLPGGVIPNPGRQTPRELFHDRRIDLKPAWEPPLRWTGTATPPPQYRGQPSP